MLIYCEHWSTGITSDYGSKDCRRSTSASLFLVFPVLTFWVIWKNILIPHYCDIFQPVHPAVCTDPMWQLQIQHSCTSSVCEESLVGSCMKKRSICQTQAVVYWSRPDGLWRHNGPFRVASDIMECGASGWMITLWFYVLLTIFTGGKKTTTSL